MKELKDLQVGDKVVVSMSSLMSSPKRTVEYVAKVEKSTNIFIFIDGMKFSRKTGKRVDDDRYSLTYIKIESEDVIKYLEAKMHRNDLIEIVRSFDFTKLSTDELEKIVDIIKEYILNKSV